MVGTKISYNGRMSEKNLEKIRIGENRRLNAKEKQKAKAER